MVQHTTEKKRIKKSRKKEDRIEERIEEYRREEKRREEENRRKKRKNMRVPLNPNPCPALASLAVCLSAHTLQYHSVLGTCDN